MNCGSGVQTRSIICNAATQEECERDIPEAERPCNERPCVMWETGNWSEVRLIYIEDWIALGMIFFRITVTRVF